MYAYVLQCHTYLERECHLLQDATQVVALTTTHEISGIIFWYGFGCVRTYACILSCHSYVTYIQRHRNPLVRLPPDRCHTYSMTAFVTTHKPSGRIF